MGVGFPISFIFFLALGGGCLLFCWFFLIKGLTFYSILEFLKAAQHSIHFERASDWIRGCLKKKTKTIKPHTIPQLHFIKYKSKNFCLVGNSTLIQIRIKIFKAGSIMFGSTDSINRSSYCAFPYSLSKINMDNITLPFH